MPVSGTTTTRFVPRRGLRGFFRPSWSAFKHGEQYHQLTSASLQCSLPGDSHNNSALESVHIEITSQTKEFKRQGRQ